jgi:hypothetical protein
MFTSRGCRGRGLARCRQVGCDPVGIGGFSERLERACVAFMTRMHNGGAQCLQLLESEGPSWLPRL